ncbi:hypothetical protein TGMAS_265810 [Toxoplasma gondii MAS]|uniref:Methyltransferase domain protein n=2 Tax=Toxoplasma gondii TaxID=5811 RepID=A0A086Q899_TOXGO|nr:hypothetical protein TGMAS_265810 [Toxoplasma gondii MAS]PUA85265.1 hypothetical protein TGBR9_265810 [Toxoplasma gondii TgCATBr9]
MKASSDASPCQPDNGPFASDSALQQSAKPNRPYASKAYWERRFEKTDSFFEWYAGWKQLAFVVFDTVLPVLREQQGRCRENRERDLDLNCCAVGEDWSNSQRRSVREVSESTETTPSCGDSCSVKSRPDHRSEGGSSEAGGFSQGHRLTVFHGDQSATELPKCDSEVNSASQWQTHLKQRIHPGDSAGSYRPAVTVMLGCGTSCLSLDLEEHGRFPLVLNIDFCRKPLEQLRHRARFPLSLGCPSFQATAGNGVSPDGCRDGELFKAAASASQTQLPSWGQATPAASGEFPSKTKSTAGVQPPSHLLHSFESDSETRRGPNAGRGQVWLEADARALPLRTGSVDLVIDKGLLDAVASRDGKTGSDAETAARIRSVLQETGRVLDPKGCLLLITHSSSKAVKYLACALCSMYGVGNSGLDSLRNSTKNDRDPHAVADRSHQGGGRVMEQELNSLQEAVPPLTHAVCEADEATHRTRRCLLSRNQCSCGQYWDILREDTVALSPAVAVANLVNVALSGHRGETPSPQESTGNETDATQLLASKVGKPGENSEDSEATQRHERNAAIRQWQTLQIARRFFRLARGKCSLIRRCGSYRACQPF